MDEFALTKDGETVAQITRFETRPPDPAGKDWHWLPVVRGGVTTDAEIGQTVDLDNDQAVVRSRVASLDEEKAAVCIKIDNAATAARLQFMTGGDGMDAVYERKNDQAQACLAAYGAGTYDGQNPPPSGTYPALEAEVGITGDDVPAVATAVAAARAVTEAGFDAIEPIRLGAKQSVADAATSAEVSAIFEAIVWPQPSA